MVVPVKDRHLGKSRLLPPPGVSRSDLAAALARDTLVAVRAVVGDGLLVVTSDARIAHDVGMPDECVLPDPGSGLDAAVQVGVAEVAGRRPHAAVAVLLGDLPALRPDDLRTALDACAAHVSAVVPDAEGTGTVLLTHRDPTLLTPSFGPGSAARHGRHAVRVEPRLPRLRRDVDDDATLQEATALGLGEWTRRLVRPT